jgi:hypothetical protein
MRIKDPEKTESAGTITSIITRGTMEYLSISKRADALKFPTRGLEHVLPLDDPCTSSMAFNECDCPWPARFSPWRHHLVSESEDDALSNRSPFHGSLLVNTALPATRALEKISILDASRMAGILAKDPGHKKMIRNHDCTLKRHRSSIGLLDLSDLHEATQPMADSLSFPNIEWSFPDDGDTNEARDVPFPMSGPIRGNALSMEPHKAKRQCKGLLRSIQLPSDLYLLDEHA